MSTESLTAERAEMDRKERIERDAAVALRIQQERAQAANERASKRARRWAQETEAEEWRKKAEEERNAAIAAATQQLQAAKEAERAQRDAAKKADEERKGKPADLSERFRRSVVWCNCSKPDGFGNHKEKCRILCSSNEVLWIGADLCISQETVAWY